MSLSHSQSSERSESPGAHDDRHSSAPTSRQAIPATRPEQPRLPPAIAAPMDRGHLAPPAVVSPPLGLAMRAVDQGGRQSYHESANKQHKKITSAAFPQVTDTSHASVSHDDRLSQGKDVTPSSKTSHGMRQRESPHGRQPEAGAAPGDNAGPMHVMSGQMAVVAGHPSTAKGSQLTLKPTSAIPAPTLPPLTRQPMQIDTEAAPAAPRLIFTKARGLVPTQLIPQVREADPHTAAQPVQQQGGTRVALPLQIGAAVPGAVNKGDVPSSDDRRRPLADDRMHTTQSHPVPRDESTPTESQDETSSPAVRSPLNARRPTVESERASTDSIRGPADDKRPPAHVRRASINSIRVPADEKRPPVHVRRTSADSIRAPAGDKQPPVPVRRTSADLIRAPTDDKRAPVHGRRTSVDSIRVLADDKRPPVRARRTTADSVRLPADDKRPPVQVTRSSAESGHPSVSTGEHAAQRAAPKASERSVAAPSGKAETAGAGQSAKKPPDEEGPPPPPPSADATAAWSAKGAAIGKVDLKPRGSIAATAVAQPAPPPKSSWWATFANPFSLLDADAAAPAPGGHEEPVGPSHARRHSVAVVDNQRAAARANLRMKRAPLMVEELREYAAGLDGGAGGLTGAAALVPPAAPAGRPAPQQNVMIEDYLDYELGPRLQHSLDIELTNEHSSRRRRKRVTCAGVLGRCLLLIILVMAPCSLLYLTFRLGQILYMSTPPQRNIALTTTSETTTETATTGVTTEYMPQLSTESFISTTTAAPTTTTTTVLPRTEQLYDDLSGRDPGCVEPVYTSGPDVTDVVDIGGRSYTNKTATLYRKLLCVLDSTYFSPRRLYVLERLPTAYCSELIYYALFVSASVVMKRRSVDSDIFSMLVGIRNRRRHRGKRLRLHITLGGSRRDSPSLVRLLEHHEVRDSAVNELKNLQNHFDGVNLHWDRPGDNCDKEFTATFFRALIEELHRRKFALMVTVPPVVELVRKFWLINIMRYLDYVIVLTHTLRRKGLLDCPGRRQFAAASYHAVREHVLRETSNPQHAAKVVYSISLGADVFKATLPLNYPRLLDAATPSSVFNGPTVQANKTSYDHVCRLPKNTFDNDGECAWVLGASSASGTEIALYAGPEELALRMRRSYADRIGDATVAVFDLFLDDFDGHCSGPGQQGGDSPLVAAIAESSLPS